MAGVDPSLRNNAGETPACGGCQTDEAGYRPAVGAQGNDARASLTLVDIVSGSGLSGTVEISSLDRAFMR